MLAMWEYAHMIALGVLNAMVPRLWRLVPRLYLSCWWNEVHVSSAMITFDRLYQAFAYISNYMFYVQLPVYHINLTLCSMTYLLNHGMILPQDRISFLSTLRPGHIRPKLWWPRFKKCAECYELLHECLTSCLTSSSRVTKSSEPQGNSGRILNIFKIIPSYPICTT